jgi:Skp family chaperone for outer membrane proteins
MRPEIKSQALNHTACIVTMCLFCSIQFALPIQAFGQKKQLTALGPVVKIAYIDQAALRKGYKAFESAKAKIANDNIQEKNSFDQSLHVLDQQTKDLLKQDSATRGKKKDEIIRNASSKRSELTATFQTNQKNRNVERISMMKQYEQKITAAIDRVVSESGFTEVKPLEKGTVIQNGKDITTLVLQKLNQN